MSKGKAMLKTVLETIETIPGNPKIEFVYESGKKTGMFSKEYLVRAEGGTAKEAVRFKVKTVKKNEDESYTFWIV